MPWLQVVHRGDEPYQKNAVIWYGSCGWEEERRRLLELPALVHEVMWVNLGKGAVKCQVARLGHSDPTYKDCCRIVVPPFNAKVTKEADRKYYNHVPTSKLLRDVPKKMPHSWAQWLADLLRLEGGVPEVREGSALARRVGTNACAVPNLRGLSSRRHPR